MYNIKYIIQMKFRKETDSMGTINVDDDKYWGASTERSKKYFDIGKILVSKTLINAIAVIKLAAAKVHKNDKQIDTKICNAIVTASKEIISGKLNGNFPLKVWQTGSGTQTNMNANEVISNYIIKKLNGKIGSKKPIHPNDHVNLSQSSNDTFPTIMHVAINSPNSIAPHISRGSDVPSLAGFGQNKIKKSKLNSGKIVHTS